MNLSQWAEQQISIAQLYRNLSQVNPVTLFIQSGEQSFSVLVSHTEPGFNVPFNVIWVCAGEAFNGAVLRRVSENPLPPFANEWIELETFDQIFSELPYWHPDLPEFGEIERFAVGPATTDKPGIFRTTTKYRAVETNAREMSDAREALEHEHDQEPNQFIQVGDLKIDVSQSKPPKAGDVLVITKIDDDGVLGEWMQLADNDILYDGPWPVSLRINGPSGPVNELTQVQFTADLVFEDDTVKRVKPVWELSDTLIGTLSEDGIFQAYNIQQDVTVKIKARFYHEETETTLSASVDLLVRDVDSNLILASLEASGPATVNKGATATYTATAVFTNGSRSPVVPDYWRVGNADAGTITANGIFTAKKVIGSQDTRITAMYTYKGVTKQAFIDVEVLDTTVYPQSARIIGPDTLDENTSDTYKLEVTFINGRKQVVAVKDWAHTNQAAGRIGQLTGTFVVPDLSENKQTKITASYSLEGTTISAEKDISVIDTTVYPARIDIIGPDFVIEGRAAQFSALVYFTDGTSGTKALTWSQNTTAFGSIDPASGLFTAIGDVDSDKTVKISTTYTANGKTVNASKDILVKTTLNLPVSAIITAPSAMRVGESATLAFTVTYADGTTGRVKPQWALSNTNIASISADGLLTAKQVLEASVVTIEGSYSASGETIKAQAVVTINDLISRPLSAEIIGPASVASTNTAQYQLSVKFSDGGTRLVAGVWQSSDRTVATIDSSGILRPYAKGETTLTAVYSAQGQTVSSTKEITVI